MSKKSAVTGDSIIRMRAMRTLGMFLVLLATLPMTAQRDEAHPTQAQFDSVLKSIQTHPQWFEIVGNVRIEDLGVSYAEGKALEEQRGIVEQDITMVGLWAIREQRETSLFAEVNLMSAL